MSDKPKPKKTPEQLKNLALGRQKRAELIKKVQFKEPSEEEEIFEEPSNNIVEEDDSDYIKYLQFMANTKKKPQIPEPEPEEPTPLSETAAPLGDISTAELEQFIYECIDKYFERLNNANAAQSGPEIPSLGGGIITKLLPFGVAYMVAKNPAIIGSLVEYIMPQAAVASDALSDTKPKNLPENIEILSDSAEGLSQE